MALNLQVEQPIAIIAQAVKDETGNTSPLSLAADAIGIGTREPQNPLTVAGPNNVGPNAAAIELTNTAETGRRFAVGSAMQGLFQIADLTAGGATRFVVDANGNVGIGGTLDPAEKLVVVGNILATGDVRLSGGDCAEEFDIEERQALDPGTVMVIGDEERLRQCREAYDTKVAGVLSGAGDCKPGILLGKQASQNKRMPLALSGKVYCKVDAQYGAITTGDLLTTSPTPGCAMKVSDPLRASGAILGKALRPLTEGRGLIPILVALQ
jgi:hypothetical protein